MFYNDILQYYTVFTIFYYHIEDISQYVQAKILRSFYDNLMISLF